MDVNEDKTVANPVKIVPIFNVWKVSSENGFAGGELLDDVDVSVLVTVVDVLVSLDGNKLRIPITEYAVENKVKKNPIRSTLATFNN